VRRALDPLRADAWGPPLVAFALLLVVWQVIAVRDRLALPTIGQILGILTGHPVLLLREAATTLAEALPGVAVSFGAAMVLAVGMNQSRAVSRALLPLAVVLNVTPIIAIAPALGVALGIGYTPRPVVTAVITFFPALINTMAGLRSADPRALEVFQSLSASRWETLWRLQLPSSLPYLFAAARVVVPLSLVGAAVSEMVTTGPAAGLGYYIAIWSSNAELDYAWAGIVTLAAFGLALTGLVVALEDRVLRWRGFR
jgi:NitT/TauT family transport system permease protein